MKKVSIILIFFAIIMGLFFLPEVNAIDYDKENEKIDDNSDYINPNEVKIVVGQGQYEYRPNHYKDANEWGSSKPITINIDNYIFLKDKPIEIYIATEEKALSGTVLTNITDNGGGVLDKSNSKWRILGTYNNAYAGIFVFNNYEVGEHTIKIHVNSEKESEGIDFYIEIMFEVGELSQSTGSTINIQEECDRLEKELNVDSYKDKLRVVIASGGIKKEKTYPIEVNENREPRFDLEIVDTAFEKSDVFEIFLYYKGYVSALPIHFKCNDNNCSSGHSGKGAYGYAKVDFTSTGEVLIPIEFKVGTSQNIGMGMSGTIQYDVTIKLNIRIQVLEAKSQIIELTKIIQDMESMWNSIGDKKIWNMNQYEAYMFIQSCLLEGTSNGTGAISVWWTGESEDAYENVIDQLNYQWNKWDQFNNSLPLSYQEYVQEAYDLVNDPSTRNTWIPSYFEENSENLQNYRNRAKERYNDLLEELEKLKEGLKNPSTRPPSEFDDVLENVGNYIPSDSNVGAGELEQKASIILTVITNIGIIVSVLMSAILGVKYMLGSIEEKADYKKDMMPYLIGAILLFGISTIVKMLQAIGNIINNT